MSFIDKCRILIKAGDGGNGIVSWRREAHVPLGGPAGGNGGNGGNIYFIGDHNETSLETLAYRKKVVAKAGENGGIKNMYGHNADDVYVKVPLGTIVYNANTNELVADILVDTKSYLIASGGIGGHGNAHFKSGFNKAPTLYERGELGETFEAKIELKQISNIGLIGLPNAGKSSIISCLTNAKPKIASYQFTTLTPVLGTIDLETEKIIIADIPGLIEGASNGVGLGHEFLRHIERCQLLVHVVSLSEEDNPDIIKSVNTIFDELYSYDANIMNKPIIIVANKSDEPNADKQLEKLKNHFSNYEIFVTSCLSDEGLEDLKNKMIDMYRFEKSLIVHDEIIENWQDTNKVLKKSDTLDKTIKITKEKDHIYNVECDYLKYWTHRVPINTQDNLIRLNQKIAQTTMLNDLKELGAIEGDTIHIYGVTLQYEE